MYRKSFTLAEVLVTLAIIGIVASLTIPSLLQNIEDAKFRPKAKTAYSILAQAFTMMQADYNIPDFSSNGSNTSMKDMFCNSMRCLQTGPANELFAPFYFFYKNNGNGEDYSESIAPTAVMMNGMPVFFINEKVDCTREYSDLKTVCGYMYVDTNGKDQAPNMLGKDFLLFWVTKENNQYKIVPAGSGDGWTCVSNSNGASTSAGCTKYYIDGRTLP